MGCESSKLVMLPLAKISGMRFAQFQGHAWVLREGQWEGPFWVVHHDVSANYMNEGKMEFAKFGHVRLKNCMSLSLSNVLTAHQWARFCMRNHLGVAHPEILYHVLPTKNS